MESKALSFESGDLPTTTQTITFDASGRMVAVYDGPMDTSAFAGHDEADEPRIVERKKPEG